MVPRQSHGAGTVRIHSIGPGDILTPTRIEYGAATEVKDQACREAACAIERIQARFVHWPIAALGGGTGGCPGASGTKPQEGSALLPFRLTRLMGSARGREACMIKVNSGRA